MPLSEAVAVPVALVEGILADSAADPTPVSAAGVPAALAAATAVADTATVAGVALVREL